MAEVADSRERLRVTFDRAAELYARIRPSYPAQLFTDLAELARGRRALEIGPGTGQATIPLVRHGFAVTGIELGASLAAVARRATAGLDVEIVTGSFEDWPLPDEPFDVVLSATSWHWIDPALRVNKAMAALREGGVLAVISTHHVEGGTTTFFHEAQRCYERYDPDTPPDLRLQPSNAIPVDAQEFGENVIVRRYHQDITYSTSEYLDLLSTYSNHIALPDDARAGLFDCLSHLIDTRYGGVITKRYLNQAVFTIATR
jgi:SAM-dependent methyltransferase